jgi:DNA-directed RNA polymerase specialized sigma24 family protein
LSCASSAVSLKETAEVLGVSASTIKRDWDFARAWLLNELRPAQSAQSHQ